MDARAARLNVYIATLTDALAYLDLHCAVCLIFQGNRSRKCKNIHECPTAKSSAGFVPDYMNWASTIKYDIKGGRAICYKCHVPSIHDTLHAPFIAGSKEACVAHQTISVVAFSIFRSYKHKSPAQAYFKQDWDSNRDKFTKWLGAKPAEERSSNMVDLMLWYLERSN